MQLIPLTNSTKTVKVDDYWFEFLMQFSWRSIVVKGKEYAVWRTTLKRKYVTCYMHALIAGTPKGFHTDHRNGDTLDNQEENLLVVTNSQNQMNRQKYDGYKGVSWSKSRGAWKAQIRKDKQDYFLGYFNNPRHAAYAYDFAARDLFGEHASFNFSTERVGKPFGAPALNRQSVVLRTAV